MGVYELQQHRQALFGISSKPSIAFDFLVANFPPCTCLFSEPGKSGSRVSSSFRCFLPEAALSVPELNLVRQVEHLASFFW